MSLLNLLPTALLAVSRLGGATYQPDIAGWVRFGDPRAVVEIRSNGRNHRRTLRGAAMVGARLHSGDSLLAKGQGHISLSISGYIKTIAAGSKPYTVPRSENQPPVGRDLRIKYLRRGGSEEDLRWLWLADTFQNLASNGRHDLNVEARLVTGRKSWDFETLGPDSGASHRVLRMSEKSIIELKSGQPGPLYIYFFDVDGSGKVSRFYRNFDEILPGSWVRSPLPVWWDLPSPKLGQAEETEYLIASATPIDMNLFDHPDTVETDEAAASPADDSPITEIFGAKNSNCRKWTILTCGFLVKRK